MKTIDLNADLGEADTPEWERSEHDILQHVSSANIACGGHAGDADTMQKILRAAKARNVCVGAHPSYPDRENFGRTPHRLGQTIDRTVLKESLLTQIKTLVEIATREAVKVRYVKPHGELYNNAVKDADMADLLAEVIVEIDPTLIFMGAPHSEMQRAAKTAGLDFVIEGFIDRRYTDDGHLQSRSEDGAVIKDNTARLIQARRLVTEQSVITNTGNTLAIHAQSLCLHGDSPGAVETARLARETIEAAGYTIKAFAHA